MWSGAIIPDNRTYDPIRIGMNNWKKEARQIVMEKLRLPSRICRKVFGLVYYQSLKAMNKLEAQ